MDSYDYHEAIKNDVLEYIKYEIDFADFETLEKLREHLNDELWTNDGVTGNGSGSYTFNTWQAEENLCHNMDLLQEALNEFGGTYDGAEAADVTIRCYLLSWAIDEAIKEIKDEFDKIHEEMEEETT